MYVLPLAQLNQLMTTKLSVSGKENARVMKQLRFHISSSTNLEIFELFGLRLNSEGWHALALGIAKSKALKRVIVRNCNLAEKDHLTQLSPGMMKSSKVEYIDF